MNPVYEVPDGTLAIERLTGPQPGSDGQRRMWPLYATVVLCQTAPGLAVTKSGLLHAQLNPSPVLGGDRPMQRPWPQLRGVALHKNRAIGADEPLRPEPYRAPAVVDPQGGGAD